MKYSQIITFVKQGNLLPYAETVARGKNMSEAERKYYERNRVLTLHAYLRFTPDRKVFCVIKCPVNPIPVRGEFELPGIYVLERFLHDNGWHKLNHVHVPKKISE